MHETPDQWQEAHDAFSAVRQLTLAGERNPIDGLSHLLLYVAENTAKVIYNASGSSAPFDKDSGVRLVRWAREFADCLGDDEFTEQLWRLVIANATAWHLTWHGGSASRRLVVQAVGVW